LTGVKRAAVVVCVGLLRCATAPPAKRPDESRRTPVNKVVPPEVGGAGKATPTAADGRALLP